MPELDFVTFGVKPDEKLLERVREALSELYSFGDFELRSAWLYYGSLKAASSSFNVSVYEYRKSLKHRRKYLRWKLHKFTEMSEDDLDLIMDGSQMMMEMSPAEREILFPRNSRPFITKEKYIVKVDSWRKTKGEKWRAGYGVEHPSSAVRLLEAYLKGWRNRKYVRSFFECVGIHRPLESALKGRAEIESFSSISKICSVALDIIREYEIYQDQWIKTCKHKDTQRRIVSSRYDYFFAAVRDRDGLFCAYCRTVENLELDHKKPVSRGGLSVLENLQFLCKSCNSDKGTNEDD